MSSLFPEPEDPLERLVRKVRDAESARVDVEDLLSKLGEVRPTDQPRRKGWLVSSLVALAASLLFAIVMFYPGEKTLSASPAELVAGAQKAHESRPELTYHVRTHWNSEARKLVGFPRVEWETVLHVRDDRFYLERKDGKPGAWGRDEKGRAWGVLGSKLAVIFDADEIPEPVKNYFDVRSMKPTKILESFLQTCDLSWLDEKTPEGATRPIVATPREVESKLRKATLYLSGDQKLIERMLIEREIHGGEKVEIEFLRVEAPPVDLVRFAPEGHLESGGKVWDRSRPLVRLQFFREFLGK